MIITLMGPTATGKTDIAIALTEKFPIEIISVDSALVYQGMNIGTAKPAKEILQVVPHSLVDIVSPEENYSVARFLADAEHAIQQIQAKGKIPLLVGGTMLYFKALVEGLAEIPLIPSSIRLVLQQRLTDQGLAKLYDELKIIDPETAARLHMNDAQRILRALEVYQASGRPLSHWLKIPHASKLSQDILQISLIPEQREKLHEVLAQRFHQMLEQGFVEEVKHLKASFHLTAEHSSMRCVGYRQVWQYLAGEINYDMMIEQGIAASRQLAKRQMTWLRSWPAHQSVWAYQADVIIQLEKIIGANLK